MKRNAILLNQADNVATALAALAAGVEAVAELDGDESRVVLLNDIPLAHKYALREIPEGARVVKYGLPIGTATRRIRAGEWVHDHNVMSDFIGEMAKKYGRRS